MTIKKNQLIDLHITGMTAEGNGVGHVEENGEKGLAVFVPLTARGDHIRCRIVKVEKRFAYGIVDEVLVPSADRSENTDCPVFGKCGGCVYRHVTYDAELRYKEQRVKDAFWRLAKLDPPFSPILPSENADGYRNKAQYPVQGTADNPIIGFFAPRSHRVIAQRDCALQPPVFAEIVNAVADWISQAGATPYDEKTKSGLLRHIYLREAVKTGQIMVCLVATSGKLPQVPLLLEKLKAFERIASVCVNVNRRGTNVILGDDTFALYGDTAITDELCGLRFQLSPRSFYQVNHDQAERLYAQAAEAADLKKDDVLLDLYCGTGTIGLSMAHRVKTLIGVEIVSEAVEDARKNAADNGITNARFLCADAAKAAAQLKKEGVRPTVVVIDPPRKGCDSALIDTIADMSPDRVVYVSCDPATLARDCAVFAQHGYRATNVTPVDMFPRTAHVETVVCLNKESSVHEMTLDCSPFEKIKSGQKTIELRLYDEKRQQIKEGDTITFTNTSSGEKLSATVKKLHRFDTFNELYQTLPLLLCGYTAEDVDNAHPSDMERYYSVEEQNQYGVVGIELFPPDIQE